MTVFLVFLFVLGTLFGSFASVLVWRLRTKEGGIMTGRSHCTDCWHELGALDLVPIFSYLFLRGKCRYCHKSVSVRYPLFELSLGILFAMVGYYLIDFSAILHLIWSEWAKLAFFLSAAFVAAVFTFYDLLFMEIPDEILMPAILIGMLLLWFLGQDSSLFAHFLPVSTPEWAESNFGNAFLGSIGIYSFFYLQFVIPFAWYFSKKWQWKNLFEILSYYVTLPFLAFYEIFKKPSHEEEVIDEEMPGGWIGLGDLRIALFMGIVGGAKIAFLGLALSYIIGSIYGVYVIFVKRRRGEEVPFWPFLSLGLFAALFFHAPIFSYLSVIFR